MKISFDRLDWEVKGYWPYVPVKEKSMETGQTLHGVTPWIKAKVPGGVHYDLWKAGYIENPYEYLNSLKCEWVENRWWMYRTSFAGVIDGQDLRAENVVLRFEGLDYEVQIFLNDRLLGEHSGMYEPLALDISGQIKNENKLLVVFKGIPQEMGQIGYTSRTFTQKSRFNYKWDFSTRLVNIGFWQGVTLVVRPEAVLDSPYISSDYREGKGYICLDSLVNDERKLPDQCLKAKITVTGPLNLNSRDVQTMKQIKGELPAVYPPLDYTAQIPVESGRVKYEICIDQPELWSPNGSGRQPLYKVTVTLTDGNQDYDQRQWFQGIRSLEYVQNDDSPKEALPYTFVVNGRKTWIKGVNMTPLDHIYGNVMNEQYEHIVAAMVNAGVNLVRIWGGGLIEKEVFYDLCDANGILVWQEFIQSSSGIDNKPSEDEKFLQLLKRNAVCTVKEKRNHTCLAAYSGGNELMEAADRPVSCENINISLLQEIVRTYDGRRLFLPTSASGPREFISREKGVSYDVHGNWRYEGNPGHYALYGESDNMFHSEFGVDGVSAVKSLKKFLPESSLIPTSMSGDAGWQHHGEWWGTYFRDCEMFGHIEQKKQALETFVRCSQYVQSEGLRFILEADRRRAGLNSGVIIWQINEPWPNASCTSLIDYYGEAKSAAYHSGRVFRAIHASLDYRDLQVAKNDKIKLPVYISNSGYSREIDLDIIVRYADGTVLKQEKQIFSLSDNCSRRVKEFTFDTSEAAALYYVTLKVMAENQVLDENTYIFSSLDKEIYSPLRLQRANVSIQSEENIHIEEGRIIKRVMLKNTGLDVAVDAGVEIRGDRYWMLADDQYFVLFPGESIQVNLLLIPRKAGTFLEDSICNHDISLRVFWL